MSELTLKTMSTGFKIGWGILLFLAAGNTLSHFAMLFFNPGSETIHLAWAAFNLLAAAILFIPYRRGEIWSWYAIWAMVLVYALVIFVAPRYGFYYLVQAITMTFGQILTYGTFFQK
jgi:hypothetical protein